MPVSLPSWPRLVARVNVVFIIRGPTTEPWGLTEMWVRYPDGIQIVLVKVPPVTPSVATCDRVAAKMTNSTRHP